jgi:hypothetical protein
MYNQNALTEGQISSKYIGKESHITRYTDKESSVIKIPESSIIKIHWKRVKYNQNALTESSIIKIPLAKSHITGCTDKGLGVSSKCTYRV